MLLHWNFCFWPPPFCWASDYKHWQMTKPMAVGLEHRTVWIYLCMYLSAPHFPSLGIQGCDKVELSVSELQGVKNKSTHPPSKIIISSQRAFSLACIPKHTPPAAVRQPSEERLPLPATATPAVMAPHLESSCSWNDMCRQMSQGTHKAPGQPWPLSGSLLSCHSWLSMVQPRGPLRQDWPPHRVSSCCSHNALWSLLWQCYPSEVTAFTATLF
jgi:hypothetical protein